MYNPNCSYVSKILSDKQYKKYETENMSLMTLQLGPFSGVNQKRPHLTAVHLNSSASSEKMICTII